MSALQKALLTENVPPLPPHFHAATHRYSKNPRRRAKEYTPLPWESYFERCEDVTVGHNVFRVYFAGSVGPVVLVLHGGGHSALSWALFTKCLLQRCECQVVAMDIRGHGDTTTANDSDLSKETLIRDVEQLVSTLFQETPPPVILIGHSMGGAVAAHTAAVQNCLPTLAGLIVIDVVEGTAMNALAHMLSFLQSRPQAFKTLEHAIEWSVRTDQVRNVESARVSVPKQFKWVSRGREAEVDGEGTASVPPATQSHSSMDQQAITEEEEEGTIPEEMEVGDSTRMREEEDRSAMSGVGGGEHPFKPPSGTGATATVASKRAAGSGFYTWRIDLKKTEPFWKGWFTGLSQQFLSCPVPKLLILAGTDRLDKDLTIGQMQGKFEMQVISGCGHVVHEDVPDKVADKIGGFLVRHKLADTKESLHP